MVQSLKKFDIGGQQFGIILMECVISFVQEMRNVEKDVVDKK